MMSEHRKLDMAFPFVLWVVLHVTFVYYALNMVHSWYRLRTVPGPFFASISYLWILWKASSGQSADLYPELGKKYGSLVRIGPNTILTDDPEVLRKMNGARSAYGKDMSYHGSFKDPDFVNMFTTTNIAEHDEIRAKLAGPYGGRETDSMEPLVGEFVDMLIGYIRNHISVATGASPTIDFARAASYFSLDIITRLAFGQELGFLRTDSDVYGVLAQTRTAIRTLAVPQMVPWLCAITTSSSFNWLLGPKTTDQKGVGVVMRICKQHVKERYEPGAPDRKDLLGAFVRSGISEGACLSETLFAMTAGSDTTASAIRSTMLHLITNHRVYYKLKQEVRKAVSEGVVSKPIKISEAKQLPYLRAVIYEGLRMRPPTPIMFPKVTPPQGDIIDGKVIPGGTTVGWNLLPMMHSKDRWGDDADIFRPERFSETDEDTRVNRERLTDLAFGYGRFGCAGKPLAFLELHKVFFELFRYFDFQLVNPAKPWKSEFWTVWMEDEFYIRVSEADVE